MLEAIIISLTFGITLATYIVVVTYKRPDQKPPQAKPRHWHCRWCCCCGGSNQQHRGQL